ncbi:transmembrane and coiled-coil domains protein 1-like isoform X2 [Notolabrus celidotus]|uniref:transmembrane and coiled-coil domains protein 1-like isoform X2 n=1 Tax=Notolabrus celidotus TaxID=1203425 RepID=UPI00149032E5|nr:transmembrane and coiled-coil domains protein 1-like isoform X2 [Notolabrus celidotus]
MALGTFKLGSLEVTEIDYFKFCCGVCAFGPDNIAALNNSDATQQGGGGAGPGETTRQLQSSQKYGRYDDSPSGFTSGSAEATGGLTSSSDNTPARDQASDFNALVHEIQDLQKNQVPFEKYFENLKALYQREYAMIVDALQEERYRCELFEGQLKDFTELHQNEILILKEELASMEEKIACLAYESATDVHEALEACQTRLFRMEQHQQVVQLEGLEHDTAQTLGNSIEVLTTLMAILLVFGSVLANCIIPLLKTCSHTFFILLFVLFFSLQVVGCEYLDTLKLSHP